jgi:hypothetical protein
VLFALLHRALDTAARTLGHAQSRAAAATALGADPSQWQPLGEVGRVAAGGDRPLRAGVFASGDRLVALNRPLAEDIEAVVPAARVNELFAGLDYRVLTETLEDRRSLTNEIWRTFLGVLAVCLLGEALLCLPPRRDAVAGRRPFAVGSAAPAA